MGRGDQRMPWRRLCFARLCRMNVKFSDARSIRPRDFACSATFGAAPDSTGERKPHMQTLRKSPKFPGNRINVLHGRKSINCANSVLPVFMARSSPAEGRRGRHGIQIDTTDSDRKNEHFPPVIGDPRSANRTPVMTHLIFVASVYSSLAG